MINKIKKNTQERLEKIIEIFNNQINKIRTGRASPNLLNNIMIKCYDKEIPLNQLAHITVDNSNTFIINVFDYTLVTAIEKAIKISNLDLNPFSSGIIIKVPIPLLTEERRKKLIKIIRNDAEHVRILVRNIRRDANDKIKNLFKNKEINEDYEYRLQDDIQKLANNFIQKINKILEQKEKELMIF